MAEKIYIKRALLSCWDKTGIEVLANKLKDLDVEIVSSGGTADYLQNKDIPVIKVEEITDFPPILDGRVKTLHPYIHGGILAKRNPDHLKQLQEHGIKPIDLVIVNLYPFLEYVKKLDHDLSKMIEMIDIGGPAMLRAAAKNFNYVAVLHNPNQYDEFLSQLDNSDCSLSLNYCRKLSADVFFMTSYYDSQINFYLDSLNNQDSLPNRYTSFYIQKKQLRYGENPHQLAALYQPLGQETNKEFIQQLWGKEMSFNNYIDVTSAAVLINEFDEPAIAIIKHTNPCGTAVRKDLSEAFAAALAGDPVSAFGGIIAANRPIDKKTADMIQKSFFECIIAPDFAEASLEILNQKKNLRILKAPEIFIERNALDFKKLPFGELLQQIDNITYNESELKSVCFREPSQSEKDDLLFAWTIVKHVKSNAIVFAKNKQVLGIGAGQMSRVDSVKIARDKAITAGHNLEGAVMASDAFFPFKDGVEEAANCGITAVIQPGGSVRDKEVIEAGSQHNMAMLFTGIRHFKH